MTYTKLSRGAAWLDTGKPNTLSDASAYIRIIEERTGLKIGCLEEIALKNAWITASDLQARIKNYRMSEYTVYLEGVVKESLIKLDNYER